MPDGDRRLAAIMFTDMVGYTALGQRNESLSLALVEEQRKLIRPILSRHNGREVKTIGDAFLVEFPSALDAIRCSYDIQRATREFNVSLPQENRVRLRVGIHLGDVVESRGDISGDAVNVASRIEALADEGGVCLTRQVFDHIQNKFDLPLVRLGTRSLKNVSLPLEVYKMVMPWEKSVQRSGKRTGELKTIIASKSAPSGRSVERRTIGKFILELAMKDRVTVVKMKNNPEMPEALARFSKTVDYGVGETLHITTAVKSISVVVDSKNLDQLTRIVPRKSVLAVYPRLAEIIISLPDETLFMPGVVSTISSELAKNKINILEYFTSTPQQIIVVDEKDALKCYQLLKGMTS